MLICLGRHIKRLCVYTYTQKRITGSRGLRRLDINDTLCRPTRPVNTSVDSKPHWEAILKRRLKTNANVLQTSVKETAMWTYPEMDYYDSSWISSSELPLKTEKMTPMMSSRIYWIGLDSRPFTRHRGSKKSSIMGNVGSSVSRAWPFKQLLWVRSVILTL